MSKSLSRQPYSGNPTVRDENGGFENRVLRNKNMRSKSIQTASKRQIRVLTLFRYTEGNTRNIDKCEMLMDFAWSETLYMYRNSISENREILQLTLSTR